jgi:hypothetical protein
LLWWEIELVLRLLGFELGQMLVEMWWD